MKDVLKTMWYGLLEIGLIVLFLAAFFAICGLAMLPIWLADIYSPWWLLLYVIPFIGILYAVGMERADREKFQRTFYDEP